MTTRYQHSPAELVAGIAQQVGGLLWKPDNEPENEPDEEGLPTGD